MPAVIDPNTCDRNWAVCFPAKMCPKEAFSYNSDANEVVIDDALCGDCPGPCVNFCDQYAIRYTLDPSEFEILKAKTIGELSEVEANEELQKLKEEKKQAAEAEEETGATVDVTSDTFEQVVLQSELPVIVDFWAPWCGPCKQMAPVFEKLAEQYTDSILFAKVNVDEEQRLAMQFQVSSIPTLALFWQGQLVDSFAGALSEPQLQSLAYQFLAAIRTQASSGGDADDSADVETP